MLRRDAGEPVLVFNGRDGEWRAEIEPTGRKAADLVLRAQTRPQTPPGDLHYLFAPLKAARLDYVAQKAVEMGASLIQPVVTRRTQGDRIKLDKLRANAIEAAEQCGILSLPEIRDATPLGQALAGLAPERLLVFCDEDAPLADPVMALRQAAPGNAAVPLAVVIGPEGVHAGGAHPDRRPSPHRPSLPRPADPARRHRRRGGAGPGPGRARRRAATGVMRPEAS